MRRTSIPCRVGVRRKARLPGIRERISALQISGKVEHFRDLSVCLTRQTSDREEDREGGGQRFGQSAIFGEVYQLLEATRCCNQSSDTYRSQGAESGLDSPSLDEEVDPTHVNTQEEDHHPMIPNPPSQLTACWPLRGELLPREPTRTKSSLSAR